MSINVDWEKKKKTDEQIINRLLDDTREGKLTWYFDEKLEYIYCRRGIVKDGISNIKGSERIDIIFRLSDSSIEEEQEPYYEFQDYFMDACTILSLDIYMSKNLKKEIFCRRIIAHQLKLTELLGEINYVKKKRPKK